MWPTLNSITPLIFYMKKTLNPSLPNSITLFRAMDGFFPNAERAMKPNHYYFPPPCPVHPVLVRVTPSISCHL